MSPRPFYPTHPSFPFAAWRAVPRVMADAHTHTDIELNFCFGTMRYFLAGRFWEIPPQTLSVFWAGLPHRLVAVSPEVQGFWMTLPLAWFLNWRVGENFAGRIMAGEMVTETNASLAQWDAAQFERWAGELTQTGGVPAAQVIALLEVEARLRRLANAPVLAAAPLPAPKNALQPIADYLSRHFQDPGLSVQTVARELSLHPNYVQTAFKNGCGLPVWEYLTRLRVSHAQRLLLTTSWTVERIARDSGFGSSSRFFAAFKARCQTTPRKYRLHGGRDS